MSDPFVYEPEPYAIGAGTVAGVLYRRVDGLVVWVGRLHTTIERAEADAVIERLNETPPPTGWLEQKPVVQ